MAEDVNTDLVELATELTIAWLGNPNNRASADEVPAFLRTMHAAVTELAGQVMGANASGTSDKASIDHVPAITPRRSLSSKDHIISMIDGKPYKTLRRHLSAHGLSPQEYRAKDRLIGHCLMIFKLRGPRLFHLADAPALTATSCKPGHGGPTSRAAFEGRLRALCW